MATSRDGRTVIESERLLLREATLADAEFMCRLQNEPAWRRFIADHDIRTPEQAAEYLRERYLPAYQHGFGLWVVALAEDATPIGICGLVQRSYLNEPDLGFALLGSYRGGGYAFEAARATVDYARNRLGFHTLAAITVPDNAASIRLLEKLAFRYAGSVLPPDTARPLSLYRLTDGHEKMRP